MHHNPEPIARVRLSEKPLSLHPSKRHPSGNATPRTSVRLNALIVGKRERQPDFVVPNATESSCGHTRYYGELANNTQRIVGGSYVSRGAFPW